MILLTRVWSERINEEERCLIVGYDNKREKHIIFIHFVVVLI